jgi:hypothetical protein
LLAGVFAGASAKADVFDFSFGNVANGTFTTGAAASDPGYKLIASLIFTDLKVLGNDFTNVTGVVGLGFAGYRKSRPRPVRSTSPVA